MAFPQGRYRHAIFAIACGCRGSFGVQPNGGNPFYGQDKGEEAVQLSMGDAIRSGNPTSSTLFYLGASKQGAISAKGQGFTRSLVAAVASLQSSEREVPAQMLE